MALVREGECDKQHGGRERRNHPLLNTKITFQNREFEKKKEKKTYYEHLECNRKVNK